MHQHHLQQLHQQQQSSQALPIPPGTPHATSQMQQTSPEHQQRLQQPMNQPQPPMGTRPSTNSTKAPNQPPPPTTSDLPNSPIPPPRSPQLLNGSRGLSEGFVVPQSGSWIAAATSGQGKVVRSVNNCGEYERRSMDPLPSNSSSNQGANDGWQHQRGKNMRNNYAGRKKVGSRRKNDHDAQESHIHRYSRPKFDTRRRGDSSERTSELAAATSNDMKRSRDDSRSRSHDRHKRQRLDSSHSSRDQARQKHDYVLNRCHSDKTKELSYHYDQEPHGRRHRSSADHILKDEDFKDRIKLETYKIETLIKTEVKDEGPDGEHSQLNREETPIEPQKPSFEPSGLLAAETNMKNGVIVKYCEPPDSREPLDRWRLYEFKSGENQENKILYLHKMSSYLIGKDLRVSEIVLAHPTISKQHAVIQFRLRYGEIKPYLIDLDSTNGTFLNGTKIESSRYYGLRNGDSLKFGKSTRDLILLNESLIEGEKLSFNELGEEQIVIERNRLKKEMEDK